MRTTKGDALAESRPLFFTLTALVVVALFQVARRQRVSSVSVEPRGIEPLTFALPVRRSPS